jgi:hypothetical protein
LVSCLQLTAKDHLRFQTSYGTVLKAHMDSLKKKEKKDKKEKKTTATKSSGFLNFEGISSLVKMRECDFAVQNLSCEGYQC